MRKLEQGEILNKFCFTSFVNFRDEWIQLWEAIRTGKQILVYSEVEDFDRITIITKRGLGAKKDE